MKVTNFNEQTCKAIDEEIMIALRRVEERFGVVAKINGGTYSPGTFTPKVTLSVVGDAGVPMTKEAERFKMNAKYIGFQSEDLGRVFTLDNEKRRIVGLRQANSSLPLIVEVVGGPRNGKRYIFKTDDLNIHKALGTKLWEKQSKEG